MTDLYKLLEISREATDSDIKNAHRRLVMKYHPDKNIQNKEDAAKKTAEINNAKEILLDPHKRAIYNRHGFQGLEEAAKNGSNQPQQRNLPIKPWSLRVDLDAFYTGKLCKFDIFLRQKCQYCTGTGCVDLSKKNTCETCKGHGKVNMQQRLGPMVQTFVTDCQRCKGKGFYFDPRYTCHRCAGVGIYETSKEMEYYVKKGSNYGDYLLENKGDYIDDHTTGHLRLTLQPRTVSNYAFTRKGSNLYHDCKLTLREALLGFDISIDHIDPNKKIVISSKEVVQFGETRKLEGWGMPKKNLPQEYGNLFITFSVELPKIITEETRSALLVSLPIDVPCRPTPNQEDDNFPLQDMQRVEKNDQDDDSDDDQQDEEEENIHTHPQVHFGNGAGGGVQCAQQ